MRPTRIHDHRKLGLAEDRPHERVQAVVAVVRRRASGVHDDGDGLNLRAERPEHDLRIPSQGHVTDLQAPPAGDVTDLQTALMCAVTVAGTYELPGR